MSKETVFISYSRDDRDFIEKLVASLRKQGLDVWFDKQLKSGMDWDDALEEQIKGTDHMIIVLSETSAASDNVKNEMRFALDHGKKIHPILYKPCSVPLSMRRMHYVDFTAMDYNDAVTRLVADIKASEGSSVGQSTKAANSRKSNKKTLLIGIVGLLLVALAIWQFWPDGDQQLEEVITTTTNQNEETFADDINWRKISNSQNIVDYNQYITYTKNTEGRLENAVKAIQDLLKDEGALIMRQDDFSEWFYKLAYKNTNGYIVNESDNKNTDWPQNGDLLVAQKQVTVMDPKTEDVMGGQFIKPGDIIQYSENLFENNGQVMMKYYFIKSKTVVPEKIEVTKNYNSRFDASKITKDMSEAEVWHLLTNDNVSDEFDGYLWYLEHYGTESRFSEAAYKNLLDSLDKEGYVIYNNNSKDSRFKSISRNVDKTIELGLFDGVPKPGDLIKCTVNSGSPVYNGVYGLHDDNSTTGNTIKKDEVAFVMDYVIEANQRQYLKVRYRNY